MTLSRKSTKSALLHGLYHWEHEVERLNKEIDDLAAANRSRDTENARLKFMLKGVRIELTKRTRVLVDLVAATIGNKS